MREKLETRSLAELKEMAKNVGLKGISGLRKAELIDLLCAQEEKSQKNTAETVTVKPHSSRVNAEKTVREKPVQETRSQETRPQENRVQESRVQENRSQENRVQETRPQENRYQEKRSQDNRNNQRNNRTYERFNQTRPQIRTYGNNNYNNNNNSYSTPAAAPVQQAVPVSQTYSTQNQTYVQNVDNQERVARPEYRNDAMGLSTQDMAELDSGIEANGILEVMPDGYGFIRCENYMPGENDVYVAPSQIRRFGLKTGDILKGNKRIKTQQEKFSALLFVKSINGYTVEESAKRMAFEDMTPIFPDERIKMETPGCSVAMRVMDLVSPVGKGQRGMIVSPPKAGKTTLLKEVAKSILRGNPKMHMLILLIDERPEEVTDIKEAIHGDNVEVIYSTFDELPEHHKRVSEMVIERAKRLVEHKMDVVILLDSITRLTRAYNLVVPPSGRTLSGGLDPAALHMPKRFFGAARNMREGGSLTILATALVETGSKMDDVVYEEFKGTGNMEMVLDRKLSEKRIFPAIDLAKSGTRREDLLLTPEELEAINIMRKALNGLKPDEATDRILDMFAHTRNNVEFVNMVKKNHFI